MYYRNLGREISWKRAGFSSFTSIVARGWIKKWCQGKGLVQFVHCWVFHSSHPSCIRFFLHPLQRCVPVLRYLPTVMVISTFFRASLSSRVALKYSKPLHWIIGRIECQKSFTWSWSWSWSHCQSCRLSVKWELGGSASEGCGGVGHGLGWWRGGWWEC